MRVAAALLVLLLGPAEALEISLEPYREARRAGALGVVAGGWWPSRERRVRPAARSPTRRSRCVPRSPGFLAKLERLKEGSRESSKAFTAAAPAMRKTLEGYERELLEAGAPDLNP